MTKENLTAYVKPALLHEEHWRHAYSENGRFNNSTIY